MGKLITWIGMLSCQQTQNVIDGKKRIILNPSEGQKKDFETITFADGEVYGIDVLVTSNEDGKVRLLRLTIAFCFGWFYIMMPGTGTVGSNANDDIST